MQELIKIDKRVIGAEETNSINARDLYTALEIKQQFGNWISKQITRGGLQENVDYIMVSTEVKAGKGISVRKDYIITTDASKHIAMMSQGAKAKEVRDYFIAVEKEFVAMQNTQETQMNLPKDFMDSMQLFMQSVSNALTEQAKAITSLTKAVELALDPKRQDETRRVKRALDIIQTPDEPITSQQIDIIRKTISDRASELYMRHNMNTSRITQLIYSDLNKSFSAKSYTHIKQKDFLPAVFFIRRVELSGELSL